MKPYTSGCSAEMVIVKMGSSDETTEIGSLIVLIDHIGSSDAVMQRFVRR